MISKLCAAWLVVLVLLPFTAPFSSFDLRDWQPAAAARGVGLAPDSRPPLAVTNHAVLSRAVPLPPRTGRQRLALAEIGVPLAISVAGQNDRGRGDAGTRPLVPSPSRLIALRV
jgi:hypothetical protein